jgi:hypothetical protein
VVSKKVTLNVVFNLLGLETLSFFTGICILQVTILFRGPLSLFTNCNNIFRSVMVYLN